MTKRSVFGKGYNRRRALVPGASHKFNPGYYNSIPSADTFNASVWTSAKQEMVTGTGAPAYKGALVRYMWTDLETTQGNYVLTDIAAKLADMKALGKQLAVMIHNRSFSLTSHVVPAYMRDGVNGATYDGGEYTYSGSGQVGYNIATFNANVQTRYIALFQAIADSFESNANFEGVGFTETSVGTATGLNGTSIPTAGQEAARIPGIVTILSGVKAALPTSLVFQMCNFTQANIASLIPQMISAGIGLACPDIMPDEPELTDVTGSIAGGNLGVYYYFNYYHNLTGTNPVPFCPMIGSRNYYWTALPENDTVSSPGSHAPANVAELAHWGRDNLFANYIFLTRNRTSVASTPAYSLINEIPTRLVEFLNTAPQSTTAAAGLSTVVPTSYL